MIGSEANTLTKINNTNNIKSKFKTTNPRLPSNKPAIENSLKISDHKLKPILDRDNLKQITYVTPLRKNIKNYGKGNGIGVIGGNGGGGGNGNIIDQQLQYPLQHDQIVYKQQLGYSSNKKKSEKRSSTNNYRIESSYNNNNSNINSNDVIQDNTLIYYTSANNQSNTNDHTNNNTKKFIKYIQMRDTYTQKSPQRQHKRFSSSIASSQSRVNNPNNTSNGLHIIEKRRDSQNKSSTNTANTNNHHNSSIANGDEHNGNANNNNNMYYRDINYNKENNDLTNITAILNQNLHISNLKIEDGDGDIDIDVDDIINKGDNNQYYNHHHYQYQYHNQSNSDNNQNMFQIQDDKIYNEIFENGKQYYRERKYNEALVCFKESLLTGYKVHETTYLIGICYLWNGEYENSIQEFSTLLEKEDFHHKNVYLLISIAYKKSNNQAMAIKMLNKAILKHPKYYDAYIYRGKLNIKDKKWEKALTDFKTAIQLNPNKGLGYIGQGDCLRMMGEHDEALLLYSEVFNKEKYLVNIALIKRSIALIELKRYDDALADLENLLNVDSTHSEAYYFKGFILQKKKDYNNAILCFEQAIKHNNSKKAVIKSLYEITKIKIENKDFYEAYHTLKRADFLKLDCKILQRFRLFTEGVIYMMKRKQNEGIESLTNVLIKQVKADFLKPLAYLYRAYGYFYNGDIKKALSDYIELQKLTKLDQSSQYNKYLCEAILYAEQGNNENSFAYFEKANKIFKNKMEPYFYKACLHIYIYKKSNTKHDIKKLYQVLNSSIKDLEKALIYNENSSNLLYHLSMIQYCLGKFKDSLKTIEKAIEKAEENYAKYYHVRGLIHAALKNYQNAISDFSIAINLDPNYQNAYLERGKCYFSYGDLKLAFLDIQKYISIMPNDPNIHLWAGNLLFNTGAYEDAAKAYSNSDDINKSEKLLLLRARCYMALKELNSALADLNKVIDLSEDIQAIFDRDCLLSLKIATTAPNNAATIKNEGEIDMQNLMIASQKINKLLNLKSCGYVFKYHDYYFYKAILHFYLQQYTEALNNLDIAWDYKEKARQEIYIAKKKLRKSSGDNESEKVIKILEEFCSDTDRADEIFEDSNNISFTTAEYLYNRAIILLMSKKYEEAYEALISLLEIISTDSRVKVELLLKLIKIEVDGQQDSGSDKTACDDGKDDIEGGDGDDDGDVNNNANNIKKCCVFPTENRLCSIFPSILINFKNKVIKTSFSFCLPYVEPPSMMPTICYEIIDDITVMSVENRPEAPWIRRTEQGVIFTENFLDREEKEIENLSEIIVANNLKGIDFSFFERAYMSI